jgi:hypothetical protein
VVWDDRSQTVNIYYRTNDPASVVPPIVPSALEEMIVGKWRYRTVEEDRGLPAGTVDFLANGNYRIVMDYGDTFSGTYKIENSTLIITIKESVIFNVTSKNLNVTQSARASIVDFNNFTVIDEETGVESDYVRR